MPFERPTLAQIYERVRSDIMEAVPEESGLRVSLADIHSKALAGAVHCLHGHLFHIATTLLPDSDDPDAINHWARVTATERKPPTTAAGTLLATGQEGAVIPAGTAFQGDEGRVYRSTGAATISDGKAQIPVRSEGSGQLYNLKASSELTLVNPIAGIVSRVIVGADGVRGGEDEESNPSLQRRYIEKMRNPPRGGHITDYIRWTEEVPGVARAFVFRHLNGVVNHVGVTFITSG